MRTYKAPFRDMQFVVHDLPNFEKYRRSLPDCDEVDRELGDSILAEAGKFSDGVVAPLNAVGDEAGCEFLENGAVRTPPGFKENKGLSCQCAGRVPERRARHDRRGVLSRQNPSCGFLLRQDPATYDVSAADDVDKP